MPVHRFALDKSKARLLGVCSGLAAYTGWDVAWIRIGAVVLTLTGVFGFLPLVYLLVAWLAPAANTGEI